MRLASSVSSLAVKRLTLPISLRYILTESLTLTSPDWIFENSSMFASSSFSSSSAGVVFDRVFFDFFLGVENLGLVDRGFLSIFFFIGDDFDSCFL
jgi:hypothetical protein